MHRHLRTALAVACLLAVPRAGAAQESAKKDLEPLQGTWRLVSFEIQGKAIDLDDKGPRWVIKGNKVYYAGKELTALTVDGATKPQSMDLAFVSPKRTYEAIYSVADDTLKICANRQTDGVKQRPEAFTTEDMPELRLLVFRRDKGDAKEGLSGFIGIRIKKGDEENEVLVDEPLKGSPAEKAGLKSGDLILKVGGKDATGVVQVVETVRAVRPNSDITLRVRRDGKERDITVRAGVMPFMYLD